MLKGTHSGVDGVYTRRSAPRRRRTRYEEIGFMEVVSRDLRVMDLHRHHLLPGQQDPDPRVRPDARRQHSSRPCW